MKRADRGVRRLIAVALVALASLALGGCLFDNECDCPEYAPYRVVDGTFRPRDSAGGTSATESLVVDRAAGVVTITSTREGRVFVERWRVTGAAVHY